MIRIMLLGLVIAISGSPGRLSAQSFQGAGTISCGEWLRGRALQRPDVHQLHAWIDGFVSGFNLAKPDDPDFLISRVGGTAMYVWMDNYCRSNPLEPVAKGALGLVKELQSRARN